MRMDGRKFVNLIVRVLLFHVVSLGLLLRAAAGSGYSPVHLYRCVGAAGVIAAGTVESITARKGDDRVIVSDVRFRDVVFLRDSRSGDRSELVIHVLGGTVRDTTLVDAGAPSFRVGERYVLFLKSQLGTYHDAYTPLVYFNQGLFPIFQDRTSAVATVHDWLRRPIAGVHQGRIVSVMPPDPHLARSPDKKVSRRRIASPQELTRLAEKIPGAVPVLELPDDVDPGLRLTEGQFLDEIRRLMTK